ncbi:hypothetical protein, partial [Burkholderia gladioli]|uniref:hypothetical protein n=1 Tax=Burkholderia gladioli TaxID=28095 RepID=UPI001ABB40A4
DEQPGEDHLDHEPSWKEEEAESPAACLKAEMRSRVSAALPAPTAPPTKKLPNWRLSPGAGVGTESGWDA